MILDLQRAVASPQGWYIELIQNACVDCGLFFLFSAVTVEALNNGAQSKYNIRINGIISGGYKFVSPLEVWIVTHDPFCVRNDEVSLFQRSIGDFEQRFPLGKFVDFLVKTVCVVTQITRGSVFRGSLWHQLREHHKASFRLLFMMVQSLPFLFLFGKLFLPERLNTLVLLAKYVTPISQHSMQSKTHKHDTTESKGFRLDVTREKGMVNSTD